MHPGDPIEFPIPTAATRDGSLSLTWHNTPGLGCFGKGVQIGEVWLVRNNAPASLSMAPAPTAARP